MHVPIWDVLIYYATGTLSQTPMSAATMQIYIKLTYQGGGAARPVSSESRARLTRGGKTSVKVCYYSPLVAEI